MSVGSGWLAGWVEPMRRRWEDSAGLSASRKASAREGNERRVNRAGVGPVLTLPIFSPVVFLGLWGWRTFPYSTLKSAGDWFSGPVPKKLYYL